MIIGSVLLTDTRPTSVRCGERRVCESCICVMLWLLCQDGSGKPPKLDQWKYRQDGPPRTDYIAVTGLLLVAVSLTDGVAQLMKEIWDHSCKPIALMQMPELTTFGHTDSGPTSDARML